MISEAASPDCLPAFYSSMPVLLCTHASLIANVVCMSARKRVCRDKDRCVMEVQGSRTIWQSGWAKFTRSGFAVPLAGTKERTKMLWMNACLG